MTDSVIFGMKLDDLQICQNALNKNFKGKKVLKIKALNLGLK